jgi:uncharacterized RDD family membrane protein YckC
VRRAAAFVIDLAVVVAAVVLLLQLVLDPLRDTFGPGWMRVGWFYIGYTLLTVSLPVWLYFAGYESSDFQATLAKRWLGIGLTSTRPGRVTFGRAFLRTIARLLPFEIAHVVTVVPANPFVDPLTGMLTIPALDSLGPSVLAGLLVSVLMLGALLFSVMLHPDGRGVHDLLAGTFVVRAEPALGRPPVPQSNPAFGERGPA